MLHQLKMWKIYVPLIKRFFPESRNLFRNIDSSFVILERSMNIFINVEISER